MELSVRAQEALTTLLEGNRRFAEGKSLHRTYASNDLREIAQDQKPLAAVLACADSRVSPEIVFDQPLGAIFCARVPGNVASDSAIWMADLAVADFQVPLILVVGHTGCLAVQQVVHGDQRTVGGQLRSIISYAVFQARRYHDSDLMTASVKENIRTTVEELPQRCSTLNRAILMGECTVVGVLYDMESGLVRVVQPYSQECNSR